MVMRGTSNLFGQYFEENKHLEVGPTTAYHPSARSYSALSSLLAFNPPSLPRSSFRLEFLGSCLMFSTALASVSLLFISNRVDAGLVGLMLTYATSVTETLVCLDK